MVIEFLSPSRLGARRLIWLIALTFCITLLVHYILLPYSTLLSSFFTPDKISLVEKKTSSMAYNATYIVDPLADSNATAPVAINAVSPPSGSEENLNLEMMSQGKSVGSNESANILEVGNNNETLLVSEVNDTVKNVNDSVFEIAPKSSEESQQILSIVNPANSSNVAQELTGQGSMNLSTTPSPTTMIVLPISVPMNTSNVTVFSASLDNNSSSGEAITPTNGEQNEKPVELQGDLSPVINSSISDQNAALKEKHSEESVPELTPLSEMRNLWLHNRSIYPSIVKYHVSSFLQFCEILAADLTLFLSFEICLQVPKWPSRVDEQIQYAKSQIDNAAITTGDPSLDPSIYWNISVFMR